MKKLKMKRGAQLAAVVAAAGLVLSACGSSGAGADATCKEFLAMNDKDKADTVVAFAKSEGAKDDEITDSDVELVSGLFTISCSAVKDDGVKLKNLDEADFDDEFLGDVDQDVLDGLEDLD